MTPTEVENLGGRGWISREDFSGAAEVARVATAYEAEGQFVPAGVSRGHLQDTVVRNDSLRWVSADDVLLRGLFATFEALRLELNEGAWLGLHRFELQLAHYKPGGHYARHRDALQGVNNRRVTAIVYLNPIWTLADGGQLRLFCEPAVDIEPRLGRLVVFMSEKVEHEVLSSAATRLAATAWYYGR